MYSGNQKPHTVGTVSKLNRKVVEVNRNDPDLVQAFLNKWWLESDFKAPNLPLSLRFKGSCQEYEQSCIYQLDVYILLTKSGSLRFSQFSGC
jgi:hypothetical protein